MQQHLLETLEDLVEANADSFEAALTFAREGIIADIDLHHLSAIQVARSILQVQNFSEREAQILLMLLAYPELAQGDISKIANVSARTIKRIIAKWRRRFAWVANLADLRAAIAPRKRVPPGGGSGPSGVGGIAVGGGGSVLKKTHQPAAIKGNKNRQLRQQPGNKLQNRRIASESSVA